MKKVLTILLTLLLLFIFVSCSNQNDGEVLVSQTIKNKDESVDVFRFTPENFTFNGTDTPIIYVLSDAKTVDELVVLLNSGFRTIAENEKCSIIFISSKGDSWNEEDYEGLRLALGNSSEQYLPGLDYSSGVTKKGLFIGSHFRKYIFATGSSVSVIGNHLNDGSFIITEWGSTVNRLCAGFVTFETKADIVNGFENIKNRTITFFEDNNTCISQFSYYEEEGITINSITLENGVNAIEYIPEGTTKESPLVVVFHGRGSHPTTAVRELDLPSVANENGFRVLAIEGPYNKFYGKKVNNRLTTKTYEAIMDYVGESKCEIYLVGFSQGAYRVMALGAKYPDAFTKICSCELVRSNGLKFTSEIPTMIISGRDDFYNVLPSQNKWAGALISNIYDVNIKNAEELKDAVYSDIWDREVKYINSFENKNYKMNINLALENLVLCDVEGLSHNVFPDEMQIIWSFFEG